MTELFLSQFNTISVDHAIVDNAGKLFRKYNSTHGIDANDAILAATVYNTGGIIYALNIKHYPMNDLTVKKAW